MVGALFWIISVATRIGLQSITHTAIVVEIWEMFYARKGFFYKSFLFTLHMMVVLLVEKCGNKCSKFWVGALLFCVKSAIRISGVLLERIIPKTWKNYTEKLKERGHALKNHNNL